MQSLTVAALLTVVLASTATAQEISHPGLRDELVAMREQDQKFRLPEAFDAKLVAVADRKNKQRLQAIIKEFGWPTASMVGRAAAQGAWLIAQHADDDREFQLEVLAMIKPLSEQGRVPKSQVAYLHDRVTAPQRYGTQGSCVAPGQWAPREIEDPELVEDRRKSMGLEPLAKYVERASSFLCRPKR